MSVYTIYTFTRHLTTAQEPIAEFSLSYCQVPVLGGSLDRFLWSGRAAFSCKPQAWH